MFIKFFSILFKMLLETVIAIIVIVALIIGSFTDFKVREVPDWLSYGLIFIGLGTRALYSLAYFEWRPIVEGLLGFGTMFILALVMFYTGQWGGGDSKVLMGLGALLGLWWDAHHVLISFVVNALIIGAVYGLLFSIIISLKHRKIFLKEFIKLHAKTGRNRLIAFLVLVVCLIVGYLFPVLQFRFPIIAIGILVSFGYYFTIFIKTVEKACMLKRVDPSELTEGEWIAHDIKFKGRIIAGPKDLGISKEQIAHLVRLKKQKKLNKVLIKVGIPFVPSFFVAYIITLIFGNWFFSLVWGLF